MQRKLLTPTIVLTALMLSACASSPARFYTLAAPALPATTAPQGQTFFEMPLVSVPERFARPQIANRLGAVDVTRGGRPSGKTPVYRIVVQLRQLEAMKAGTVEAQFDWSVVRTDNSKHAACRLTVSEPVQGGGIDALVAAMQRSVDKVSAAIATDVQVLRDGKESDCRS